MKFGAGWLVGGMLVGACGPTIAVVDTDGAGTGSATNEGTATTNAKPDTGQDADGTEGTEPGQRFGLSLQRDVDLLIVMDNSSSMAEEQGLLAASIGTLTDALDAAGIHYRIGVTTTDNGNPWCTGTTPEGGALRLSSCRARAQEFQTPAGSDVLDVGCLDVCDTEQFDVTPTPIDGASDAAARPWLEVNSGLSNIAGVSPAEAMRCALPQGVNGCGFEQPLESMYKALKRSMTDAEAGFGFVRPASVLGVLVVTDEVDCSHNPQQESIFLPDGDRVFWSNPTEAAPTSAVCWNAGVLCDTGGSCGSANYDALGNATDEDTAVLRPVSRYVDILQGIEDQKKQITPDQEVVFAMIGGVGPDGSVTYQDAEVPEFHNDYGIGPGCVSSTGEALPPVRLREVGEQVDDHRQTMFSICAPGYQVTLQTLADRLIDQIEPLCMPQCVADVDPTTAALEPDCTLTLFTAQPDGSKLESDLPPCAAGTADTCWSPLVDGAMSDACTNEGYNLEFRVTLPPGTVLPLGSGIYAECEPSANKPLDCPDLP